MTGAQLELDAGFQDGSRSWLSHTKEVNPHANLDGCVWEPVNILAHIPMAWLLIALSVPDLIVRQVNANVMLCSACRIGKLARANRIR
jgi:hypothetical protein